MKALDDNNHTKRPITLQAILSVLPLVLLLVTAVVAFRTVQMQLVALETNQAAIETRLIKQQDENVRHFNAVNEQLGNRIARVEQTYVELSAQLAGIKARQDMIITRLDKLLERP